MARPAASTWSSSVTSQGITAAAGPDHLSEMSLLTRSAKRSPWIPTATAAPCRCNSCESHQLSYTCEYAVDLSYFGALERGCGSAGWSRSRAHRRDRPGNRALASDAKHRGRASSECHPKPGLAEPGSAKVELQDSSSDRWKRRSWSRRPTAPCERNETPSDRHREFIQPGPVPRRCRRGIVAGARARDLPRCRFCRLAEQPGQRVQPRAMSGRNRGTGTPGEPQWPAAACAAAARTA